MLRVVTPTRWVFDPMRLRVDVERVIALCPFFAETDQISLRHRAGTAGRDPQARFRDGVGHMRDAGPGAREADFDQLHELVRDSYLGAVYGVVEANLPRAGGRYRIRRLRPGACIPWHVDDVVKYHIPVVTNPGCFFVTRFGAVRLPEAGRLYVVRTDLFHTAMNASKADRIHLAVDTTRAPGRWPRLRARLLHHLSR